MRIPQGSVIVTAQLASATLVPSCWIPLAPHKLAYVINDLNYLSFESTLIRLQRSEQSQFVKVASRVSQWEFRFMVVSRCSSSRHKRSPVECGRSVARTRKQSGRLPDQTVANLAITQSNLWFSFLPARRSTSCCRSQPRKARRTSLTRLPKPASSLAHAK